MKQKITIPNRVTHSVFRLPCICSVNKRGGFGEEDEFYYILHPAMMVDDSEWQYAHPGDTLIEDGNGKWRVELKEEEKE